MRSYEKFLMIQKKIESILVRSSSFENTKVWEENLDRYFPDVETMTGWIDHMSIILFHNAILDKDRQIDFRNIVAEKIIAPID